MIDGVAPRPVDIAAHRVADQSAVAATARRIRRWSASERVEGFVRRPVGDELDADEEAAATNVADRRRATASTAPSASRNDCCNAGPSRCTRVDQTVALDDALHCCAGGAGERVPGERVPGHRATRDRVQHFGDSAVVQRGAQRHIAPAEALGDRHDVGHHAVVFQGRATCRIDRRRT